MSTYLDSIAGYMVPASSTPADLHNYIKARFTSVGYQVVAEDTGSVPCQLYVIPPATESIGNSQCREVLNIVTDSATLGMRAISQALLAYPQTIGIYEKTAGAVACAVTINGVTVTGAAGSAGSTAVNNLRALYEAIVASTDANFTDWYWAWDGTPTQGIDDGSAAKAWILGVRKTLAANLTVTVNANTNGGTSGNYHAAGLQSNSEAVFSTLSTITTDLASGFILFMGIAARGVSLASRTNAGYYGCIQGVWGDHAVAVASMPTTRPHWEVFLSPVELVVGADSNTPGTINSPGTAYPAKAWAFPSYGQNLVAADDYSAAGHPFTRCIARNTIMDVSCRLTRFPVQLVADGMGNVDYVANDFSIHRLKAFQQYLGLGNNMSPYAQTMIVITPPIETTDWWHYRGAVPDENIQFGSEDIAVTTLVTPLARGGSDVSITLTDASALPGSGAIVIEGEAILYTGKASNTLTGCTRGSYVSEKSAHVPGVDVFSGNYWIKINAGIIYCHRLLPS